MSDTDFSIQMEEFAKKAKANIREFHIEFAQDIAEEVVMTTPVEFGFLRGSWWAQIGAPGVGAGIVDPAGAATVARLNLVAAEFEPGETIYYMNGAAYAMFVHEGTSRMGANPWVQRVARRAPVIAEATARRIAGQ